MTLSGVHPCLPSLLPCEYLALPNHYVVLLALLSEVSACYTGESAVCQFAPTECFPKALSRPLIGRAGHLHYCSRPVNLRLVHPDGAQLKLI